MPPLPAHIHRCCRRTFPWLSGAWTSGQAAPLGPRSAALSKRRWVAGCRLPRRRPCCAGWQATTFALRALRWCPPCLERTAVRWHEEGGCLTRGLRCGSRPVLLRCRWACNACSTAGLHPSPLLPVPVQATTGTRTVTWRCGACCSRSSFQAPSEEGTWCAARPLSTQCPPGSLRP